MVQQIPHKRKDHRCRLGTVLKCTRACISRQSPSLHLLKGGGVGGADVEVVGGQHGVRYPDGFFFTIFIYESYGDLGGFAGAKFLAAVVAVKNVFDCPHGVLLYEFYFTPAFGLLAIYWCTLGQAQIAPCKFGTGLEKQKFLPNENGPSLMGRPLVSLLSECCGRHFF